MKTKNWTMWLVVAIVAGWPGTAAPEPPVRVDFETHVRPILQAHCLKCHSRGKYKGGLSLETRADTLRGGEDGPAAVVGKSGESLLVALVAGLEPDRRMPERGQPLAADQVALLRAWIDQGMSWPEGLSFGFRQAKLDPRRPDVPPPPPGSALDHPIDRFLSRDRAERDLAFEPVAISDRDFVRRASLDLVGLLPAPERSDAFEKDARPGREARLIDALLADRRAYADHWLTFWNDALRNSYRGTGFIDGGRKTITPWLYQALYDNTPYDRFVHDLVSAAPGSEGFTKGIVWRGVVNASQAPSVQAAQNVSQVFLGTNLKCASCHDSFVNHWKLTEAYALAGVFAEKPLEINRCDKPTGQTSSIGFIYPRLGAIDPLAPRAERMRRLADLLVKPGNGRFARTIVNRLWAQLMGRGIVEPLDDMDQPPWSQDLLDWLADDFVAHGHDLKHTVALIATSGAYRMPSVGAPDPAGRGEFVFRGPLTKRMTAEQFADAVSTVTGVWPKASGDMVQVDGRGQGGQVAAVRAAIAASASGTAPAEGRPASPGVEARWIWGHADAEKDPGGRILIRKVIRLEEVPPRVLALATCDNELVLYVNGREVGRSADWTRPVSVEIARFLEPGENVIAVEATNWPDAEHGKGTQIQGANPAAFIAWVGGFRKDRQVWGVGTDASWLWAKQAGIDWKSRAFDTAGWHHSVELPTAERLYGGQVNLAEHAGRASSRDDAESTPVRAALAFNDPLLNALGRTSREQVVTHRDPVATTLQALELTNGGTLDETLKQGARRWVEQRGRDPEALVRSVFLVALGRSPAPEEFEVAKGLVGSPATVEGVQDLLWTVAMLPEFQLIR